MIPTIDGSEVRVSVEHNACTEDYTNASWLKSYRYRHVRHWGCCLTCVSTSRSSSGTLFFTLYPLQELVFLHNLHPPHLRALLTCLDAVSRKHTARKQCTCVIFVATSTNGIACQIATQLERLRVRWMPCSVRETCV